MSISNYPNGFKDGVTMRGPSYVTTQNKDGNVFFVDSTVGSNGNKGTFVKPFATLEYAVGRCTADNGDLIVLAAGHTETSTSSAGINMDVDGITVRFMGEGDNKATLQMGASGSIDVQAANVTLLNPRFKATADGSRLLRISTGADNCTIINGEWHDGAAIDSTNAVTISANADNVKIHGWKYFKGNESGTQKESHIKYQEADRLELKDIDITGDFSVGNINNHTSAGMDILFENIVLKNTNSGPAPGMVIDSNTTGFAKNVDIRIDSGTTYVSSVAGLNWDNDCLGYAANGTGGDPIGTSGSGTIEAQIAAIQADLGNPSTRTNFQDIENMIGIPDAANSNLDDILRTGYDSTAITADGDGAILERQEFTQIQVTKSASKNLASVATADIFVVAGGLVKVLNITGFINTVFETAGNNTKLVNKATAGGNVDLCAVLDVTAAAAASFLSITGTFANALVNSGTTGVKAAEQAAAFIVSPGTIEMNCVGTTTGDVTWYIEYEAMDTGATIVAA